jgi:hypothetical protein
MNHRYTNSPSYRKAKNDYIASVGAFAVLLLAAAGLMLLALALTGGIY